jgi:hypothetical protein
MGGDPGLAGPAHHVKARRSAMLLRCQTVRQGRRRFDVLQAERADEDSIMAEALARGQLIAHEAAQEQQLLDAHKDLRGQPVDVSALRALSALEQRLLAESKALAAALIEAQADVAQGKDALNAARTLLQTEGRTTRKRERLANAMIIAWRHAIDFAEEVERENHAVDTWRPK